MIALYRCDDLPIVILSGSEGSADNRAAIKDFGFSGSASPEYPTPEASLSLQHDKWCCTGVGFWVGLHQYIASHFSWYANA
jgi:hypothetical protein